MDWLVSQALFFASTARILLAVVMIYAGSKKLADFKKTITWFHTIGFKPGIVWGSVVTAVELVGGMMIFLNIYTVYMAVLFIGVMLGALGWKISSHQDFQAMEVDIALIGLSLANISLAVLI